MNLTFDSVFSFVYHKGLQFQNFSHNTHELIYFLNGDGSTTINDFTYSYIAHNLCFTKVGDIRDHYCNKKTDYICIRFLCSDPLFDMKSGVYSCSNDEILSLFTELKKEVQNKNYRYYEICNLIIAQILIKLSRLQVIDIKDQAFYKLIREIDTSVSFSKSIQEMADSVSYSYDHFRHKFKEITGQSPTEYIINKRIDYACNLLQINKYTCTEISMICGFSSPAQFSSLFKNKTGISPKEYQTSYKVR